MRSDIVNFLLGIIIGLGLSLFALSISLVLATVACGLTQPCSF